MPISEPDMSAFRSAGQRQARLLERLRVDVFLDVQALRSALGVSIATIRRDLNELERRGLVKRTHGGATIINQATRDYATSVRETTNAEEKQKIAEAAAELIVEGDAVMIDSGTTSLRVARLLAANESLTFVTNGTDVLAALVAGGAHTVHLIGGEYIDINHSLGGPLAAQTVRGFHVDKTVLSVSAVDLRRRSICTSSPQIGCVQQAMIEMAQSTIVVADHSKFDRTALSVISLLDNIDYLITDEAMRATVAQAPNDIKKKFIFA